MNIHQERIELATQTEYTFQLTGDSLIDDMTREKNLVGAVMEYCTEVLKFEDNHSIETKILIEGILKRVPEVINKLANARQIHAEFEKIGKFQSQFNDIHQGSDLYKANKNQDPETCAQFYQLVREFVVYLAKAFPQDKNKQPTKFKLLLDSLNDARAKLPAQATMILPFAQSGGIRRSKGNRDQAQRPNQQHQQHQNQRQNDEQARKIQEAQLDIQESITNIHSTINECDGDGRDQIEFIEDVCGTYVKVMQNSDKKLKAILDDLRAHPDVIPREQLSILQSMKRMCELYPQIFQEFSGSAKNQNNYRSFKEKLLKLTNPALGLAPPEEDPALHQFDQKEKQKRDEEARRERIRREEEERLREMEEERLQRLKEDEERSQREKKKREEEKQKKEQQLREEQQKKEEERKRQEQKQREEQLLKAQQERVEKERMEREKREQADHFVKPRIAESYMQPIPEDSESRKSFDARDYKNSQPGSYRQDSHQEQKNQYQYPPQNQFDDGTKTLNPDDQDDDFRQPQFKSNSQYQSTQIHSKYDQQQSQHPQHNQYNYPPQQSQFSNNNGQSTVNKAKQPSSAHQSQAQLSSSSYNNQSKNPHSQVDHQSAPYNQSYFPEESNYDQSSTVQQNSYGHHSRQVSKQGPNGSQFGQQPGSNLTTANINKMSFGGGENLLPIPNRENYIQNFDTMSQVSNISYQKPHYPEVKEKNHSGRLVRFDQKQFRIFNECRLTENQIRRWKNASFKGQGSIVENSEIQIGTVQELSYNSLARRYALKISIYFGNKTNQPIRRVQNHFEGENDSHLWTKNETIQDSIEPGSQIVQEVIVGFSKPDYRFINGVFQSADQSGHIQKLQWILPMSLFSFIDFKDIDPRIFKPKWKNLQSYCIKSESFSLNQRIYKSVDIFKQTIPKLCELVSSRYFNNQFASNQNFRCYKLGGVFELLNGEFMLKLIIYPDMRFLVKLSSQHQAIEQVLHNICFIFQQ